MGRGAEELGALELHPSLISVSGARAVPSKPLSITIRRASPALVESVSRWAADSAPFLYSQPQEIRSGPAAQAPCGAASARSTPALGDFSLRKRRYAPTRRRGLRKNAHQG